VGKRSDQIFQLSLTEIAFTIAFILLLLLGYLVFKEQSERLAAERALAKIQSVEAATVAFEQAKSALTAALQGAGSVNPEEVISKLTAAEEVRSERVRLKKEIVDLNDRLTALTELQSQIEKAAASAKANVTKEEVRTALVLQEELRRYIEGGSPSTSQDVSPRSKERLKESVDAIKHLVEVKTELQKQLKTQLERKLEPGKEASVIQEVVTAARTYGELAKIGATADSIKKENSDLRGQVAFFKNKLDAKGGRDYPPCWADGNGKPQFLFIVETKPDAMVVTQGWQPERDSDARALPGLADVLSGSPHSYAGFVNRIQGIFNWSKVQDPQCRHYVQLKSTIADAVQSDRARLMVENYFYKLEVRR